MGLLEAHADLAGKVAVVVGGASGFIGRAVTLTLAKAGVSVACCDNDAPAVEAIVGEVEALGAGGRILSGQADVLEPEELDGFYDRVAREFESVDILVNVAGGVKRSPFMETTRADNAR